MVLLFSPALARNIISALCTKLCGSCRLRAISSSSCFCSSLSLIFGQVRMIFSQSKLWLSLLSYLSRDWCTRSLSNFQYCC
jgi:hypothetical protein